MAVTPFISTSDMYNPFRQAGDAGGMLYGQRRTALGGGGNLGPKSTPIVPTASPEATTSLYSGGSGGSTGRDDDDRAGSPYSGNSLFGGKAQGPGVPGQAASDYDMAQKYNDFFMGPADLNIGEADPAEMTTPGAGWWIANLVSTLFPASAPIVTPALMGAQLAAGANLNIQKERAGRQHQSDRAERSEFGGMNERQSRSRGGRSEGYGRSF